MLPVSTDQSTAMNMRKQTSIKPDRCQDRDLYRFIVENSHIGIFVIDDAFRIIYCNDELIRIMGYPEKEIIASDFRKFLSKKDRAEIARRYRRRQGGEIIPHRYEIQTRRKDGVPKTLDVSVAVTRSLNDTPLTVVQVFDITERLKDKKALAASEEKYRTIVQNIEDMYFELDLTGHLVFFNDAVLKNFGYTPEEAMGMHYTRYISPDHLDQAWQYFTDRYRAGKIGGLLNYTVIRKDGSGMDIEVVATVIRNESGKTCGFRGIARDVTQRKRAEQNLRDMHEALEKKVQERTQGLEEANVALKVLLKKRESDREELGKQMVLNIREIISPYIERLKNTSSREMRQVLIEIIERNLEDVTSPFMQDLALKLHRLTPSEIQIINLIKHNKTSKEIAAMLAISPRTVETHRDNIRKKLGIKNRKINLKSYLLSIG